MEFLKKYIIERNGYNSLTLEGKGRISKLRRFFGDSKSSVMVKVGIPLALVAAMVFPGMAQAAEKTEATIENVNEGVTSIEQTVETDATTYSAPEVITTYSNTVSTSSATTESTSSSSTTETTESTDDVTIEEENDATLEDSSTEIVEDEVVSENSSMEVDGEIITDEVTDEQEVSTLSTEETTEVEEDNYLEPTEAVDGVDISDSSSNQGEAHFDQENTNLIIIEGKDGNKIVIWTDESYGNPNQALIHENLVNSNLTNLDGEQDYTFISEFDYTDPKTGYMHCVFDGGEIVYNPYTGEYTVYYDKTMYESTMGVSITAKEYIDPDTQEPVKPIEDEPEPEPESEPEPEPEAEPEPESEPELEPEAEPESEPEQEDEQISQSFSSIPKTGDDLDLTGMALAGGVALVAGATASRARRKFATDGYEMDDEPQKSAYERLEEAWDNKPALEYIKNIFSDLAEEEQEKFYTQIANDQKVNSRR